MVVEPLETALRRTKLYRVSAPGIAFNKHLQPVFYICPGFMETTDQQWMQRAFDLAQMGAFYVSPNPMVGAVIVHNGRVIGEGYHARYGGPHAEVNAVASVADPSLLPEATLYCTLEPCFHHGKTPPCVELVLQHRFRRVVVGAVDINPLVAGKSIEKMRSEGITVDMCPLDGQFARQNPAFMHWMNTGGTQPYIILKWAQSADGYLARTGERTAISGPVVRRLVHRWRSTCDAIMVGTQTALTDNPQLDSRHFPGKNPLRVAIDTDGKMPLTHALLDDSVPTWILGKNRLGAFRQTTFIALRAENLLNDLAALLARDKKAILLVEGGAKLLQSCIDQGFYHEIRVIENQRELGDGVAAPRLPKGLHRSKMEVYGEDVVRYYVGADG